MNKYNLNQRKGKREVEIFAVIPILDHSIDEVTAIGEN